MTHLEIIQNNALGNTEEVSSAIIQKLYELATSGNLDASSDLKGRLHVTAGYRTPIEYLNQLYSDLTISADTYIIPFEDANMVTYLNSIGVGSNGVITEADAAAATVVANSQNTTITKFNELKYFTNITQSKGGWDSSGVGDCRFKQWTALEEIDISNFTSIGHVQYYSEDCFLECTSLKTVKASNKLTKIGVYAFKGCTNLESITGLSGSIIIKTQAFHSCSKLTTLGNCSALLTDADKYVFYGCSLLSSITFDTNSSGIGENCFQNCSSLTTISLPNGVTTIGNGAFYGCSNLTTINLPSGVTTLPNGCFQQCSNLTSINLSNITIFNDSCLNGCSSLTASDINWTNVTRIGGSVFSNVHIQQQNLVIPNLTFLGAWVFGNNDSSGITSIDFTGSTFTNINAGFVEGHRSFDHVIFPDSITDIYGWGHFSNTSTRWIKFLGTTIPVFETNRDASMMGIPSSTKIYVPDSVVNDWKAATGWSPVASQIYPMSQFATDFPNG